MYACMRGNAVVSEIVREINQQSLPENQEVPYLWHPSKWERVTTRYKALFPEGKLLKKYWRYVALTVVGMLGVMISIMASGGHQPTP
jgi:hypothetical protein